MNKYLIILFIAFSTLTNLNAQFADKKIYLVDSLNLKLLYKEDKALIDSVVNQYKKAKHDTVRLSLISTLVEGISDNRVWPKYNEFMFELCNTGLSKIPASQTVVRLFYLDYKNRALNNFGYYNLMQGNIDLALEYYAKSKAILEEINDKAGLAAYYNSVGYIYTNQGSIKKGLDFMHKSLKLKEELGDLPSLATTLTNLGFVYKSQNEHDKALEYFQKSLKIREDLNDKSGIAMCLGHLGSLYFAKNELEKALENYSKAYRISKETSDEFGTAHHLQNLGVFFQRKKNYSQALKYFANCLELRRKINDSEGIAGILFRIGEIQLEMGNISEALTSANESMKMAKKLKYPLEISNTALLLQKIYKKQNKWQEALEMYELHVEMQDSIMNEETQKIVIKQQMQYTYEKEKLADSLEFANKEAIKDLEIKENQAKIQKQKAELEREAIQKKALYGGIILLALLVSAILIAFRNKKRDNEIISKQKDEVEAKKKLLEEKNKEVFDSINYAKRIQQALLQAEEHVSSKFPPHFILFKPKDIVSGDFYWSAEKNNHLFIAVVDCTGHGVPGAFMSMLGISFLNDIVSTNILLHPSEILDKLRDRVIKELNQTGKGGDSKDGMDISLLRFDTLTKKIEWAGANNPLYIVKGEKLKVKSEKLKVNSEELKVKSLSSYKVDVILDSPSVIPNECEESNIQLYELKGDKMPIGFHENIVPFTNHSIEVNDSDKLYIFSDGFADQFGGEHGKKYKYKALKELLLQNYQIPMQEQKEIFLQAFENWKGSLEQVDDVCLIGLSIE